MDRLLSSQWRRLFRLLDDDETARQIAGLSSLELGRRPDGTPITFGKFLDMVEQTYAHFDRDLTLCRRSLAISSEELMASKQVAETAWHELNHSNRELERALQKIHELAIRDELTGVFNRRQVVHMLKQERDRALRLNIGLTVMILDIDHFKHINDTYGHLTGDDVLKEVTRRCVSELRSVDVFGRYGGEEFVCLLTGTSGNNALITAERIRRVISDTPVQLSGQKIDVTVSIGVASYDFKEALDALLERADKALYRAKNEGRNRSIMAE